MATTLVTSVIDRLVQLLTEEEKLFKGVSGEVQRVKLDLEIIQTFLTDAEARSEIGDTSDDVKAWVKQVTELAVRIEIVMNKYVARSRDQNRGGFLNFLRKTGYFIKTLKSGPDIASEIQKIQASLQEIKSTSARFGFRPSLTEFERHEPLLGSQSVQEEEIIVGIDRTRENIVRRLVEGDSTLTVVSLVGMGGIGKTTLAKKAYDHGDVQRNFNCRAWINVSYTYSMRKLLLDMIEQICPAAEQNRTTEELIVSLRQYFQTKRYMVVFDDVWDVDFWRLMEEIFPDNEKGSRVIITTRILSAAPISEETPKAYVHQVQFLPVDVAWELFSKVAFRHEFEGRCPPELEELSTQIVERCRGLPLLINVTAGYLSTKAKVIFEWQRVLFYFEQSPSFDSALRVISLSYHDLPHRLKSCFLYFSVFPEDYLVSDVKLFRLWIAEGFIQKEEDKTQEQVAEEYLNELIRRNLVQISYVNHQGIEKLCKVVHNLIHEMIMSRAKETSFCDIQYGEKSRSEGKSSRLSIRGSTENISVILKDYNEVRSLFLFDISELSKDFVGTLFERSTLLTIVDFDNVPLNYLPNAVGNLLYLKCLSLRNTKVKVLPKSMGKLENLQTLDIRNTLVEELPIVIYNLKKLRQLLASCLVEKNKLSSTHGVGVKEGIGRLENLEMLMTVEANERDADCMKELEKLGQLRWLGVSRLTKKTLGFLSTSIEKMKRLELLRLHSLESFDPQSISSPPPPLQNLILKGPLQMMPDWISNLQYLSVLGLSFSKLGDDPLKCLHGLPNLVSLSLYHAFDGEQLHFEEGGFQKLKMLVLRELHGLTTLKIDRGALPLLEELQVGPSQQLDEVPSDIQHLRNLRVLEVYDMQRDFVLGMLPDEGSDYWKVENIPNVVFKYRVSGRRYAEYKLGESDLLEHLRGLGSSRYIRWDERRFSFFYSDDEDLATTSDVEWKDDHLSFFSDDIED